MKQTIRLNEAQLHKLVVEAVKRVLKNFDDPEDFHEFNANAERSVIKNRPIIDKRHKILSGHDTEPDKTETQPLRKPLICWSILSYPVAR